MPSLTNWCERITRLILFRVQNSPVISGPNSGIASPERAESWLGSGEKAAALPHAAQQGASPSLRDSLACTRLERTSGRRCA